MLRLLDLFCGVGGCSVGYARAGFEVTGVDHDPKLARHYPFPMIIADALTYVAEHGAEFDVIAASPPCQRYARPHFFPGLSQDHPDLVAATRAALIATGRPYVIENVPGAPLINPVQLCGSEFRLRASDTDGTELQLYRHRLFESNLHLVGAGGCRHQPGVKVASVFGHGPRTIRSGGYVPGAATRRALLGIDWPVTRNEAAQAIPPAYTQHLGAQLMVALMLRQAA